MAAAETIVTKGRFAEICNVSAGRVTQWIAERKISGDALVGEGRAAKIVVAIAQKQLRTRIDSGQAFGNGLGTKLRAGAPKSPPEPKRPVPPPQDEETDPDDVSGDELDAEIKREKLAQLQRINRKGAEDEAASQGRYVEAAAARRQMGIVAVQTMRVFEGAQPEMATAIASRFGVDQREVAQVLADLFRGIRAQAAEKARAAAEAIEPIVPDEDASA